ncbi:MAG: hypothetical protein JO171_07880 [Paludibacterium sp.]|uniref:hypothetical protein n=1 Tax=Paludibacterium sp. TaxID=1917523 RepID=UPI0025E15E21|nr:hypothetical protein [Paludibacterium sp.]MBV8047054.1 hypothetical protein [Paludibacterium sp.]MBV8646412.1 hypothetical protein [Paludibacterium sp.]
MSDERLRVFINQVQTHYFSHFPIVANAEGGYAGLFLKYRLDSMLTRPYPDIWLASTRFRAPTGQTVREDTVIALCRASETAVVLDRFARALHLLNLMERTTPSQTAYLPVSQALIDGVSDNHGAVFRDIVDRLALPCRIGILLPAALERDPNRLARIAASYRRNGFATALNGVDGFRPVGLNAA